MTQKLTDPESGAEIEVYTPEEIEEQKKAAVEEYRKTDPAIKELSDKLKAKDEELAKLTDKDFNFKQVREQVETLKAEKAETLKKMDEKVAEIAMSIQTTAYNEIVADLAGNDEELAKKIKFNYDRLTDKAETKEEIRKKAEEAYFLATKRTPPIDYISSAGSGAGKFEKPKELSENAKNLAEDMGFSFTKDKNYKK